MIDRLIYLEEEVIRLTRALAEAKARAVIPDGLVAVDANAIEVACRVLDHGNDASRAVAKTIRAMLSARPESPPNGLPKEPSDAE